MKFDLILNQPDAGEISINLNETAASDVTIGRLIKMVYRGAPIGSGGFIIENITNDLSASGDKSGQWKKISGRGGLAILDDAVVWSTTENQVKYAGVTMGSILVDQISQAKARGCFPNLRVEFSAILDSNGDPWTDSTSVDLSVGTSLLDVVRQFSELGIDFKLTIDWQVGDFALYAYPVIGSDKSNDVVVRIGYNAQQLSDTQESSGLKNAYLVNFQGGITSKVDATSIGSYRRREALFQAGNAPSESSALVFAGAELAAAKDPKRSIVVKISDAVNPPRAFVDYEPGDWIGVDFGDGAAISKFRIRGISLDWQADKKYANVTLTLNSLRVEQEIRTAIAMKKIANGSTNSAVSSAPPNAASQISAHDADGNAHENRPLDGDLGGTIGEPVVAALRGLALRNPLTINDGQVLRWNETNNQFEAVDQNDHNHTPAQVGLGNVPNLKCNLSGTTAPGVGDDSDDGYAVGSLWFNTTADKAYVCADSTSGAAVWKEITNASSLTVEEIDGSPSVATVGKIRITNGTLTDNGDGTVTINFGSAATDGAAIHDNESGEIHAIAEKTVTANADVVVIEDSADAYSKKRVQLSNIVVKAIPKTIPDLMAWYAADSLDLSDGAAVTMWPDLSGNGFSLYNLGSRIPTFQANEINSLPAVYFNNAHLKLPEGRIVAPSASWMMVIKFLTNVNHAVLISATGNDFGYLQYGSTWYVGNGIAETHDQNLNAFELKSLIYTSPSTVHRWTNAVDHGAQSVTGYLGWSGLGFSSYVQDFEVAEFLFFSKALSSSEHSTLRNYLNNKYVLWT